MTKTILITGSSSGFGKLIARRFHAAGWNVAATMRAPEKERALQPDARLALFKLDVTDFDSVQDAFAKARARFGRIDAVVNNAGYGGAGLFEQFSPAEIAAMFKTNVFGPMNVMREALPEMRAAGAGRIVNVTSMAGHLGLPGNAVYSATKHALVGLTEGMALEYAPLGVKIYNVAPGAYPTTGFNDAVDQRLEVGDAQLVAFSKKLRDQIDIVGARMANEGGALADPQEVAEHVFACVTGDGPVHTPSGDDAQMLTRMTGQENREAMLRQLRALLVPSI